MAVPCCKELLDKNVHSCQGVSRTRTPSYRRESRRYTVNDLFSVDCIGAANLQHLSPEFSGLFMEQEGGKPPTPFYRPLILEADPTFQRVRSFAHF